MDEIHVTSDVSYKGGEIIGSCLNPDDPIKTVFAIMVSSLHKKWSTVVRLVPLSTTRAKYIHPIIVQVIDDIEKCGLLAQALCTENYPLNVNSLLIRKLCNLLTLILPLKKDLLSLCLISFISQRLFVIIG